jgi:hypothetical protein
MLSDILVHLKKHFVEMVVRVGRKFDMEFGGGIQIAVWQCCSNRVVQIGANRGFLGFHSGR